MTRNEVEQFITRLKSASADEYNGIITALWMHDTEQRNIIDEQVEENRGLRADVKLMQQVNDEQREESRLLEEKLKGLCCAHGNALMQIHDKDKEIRLLSEQVNEANQELLRRADEITRLRGELSHWTFVRFKELEAENERLRMSLQGIIDIGKRDMTNPKYDGYFEAANQALTQEPI